MKEWQQQFNEIGWMGNDKVRKEANVFLEALLNKVIDEALSDMSVSQMLADPVYRRMQLKEKYLNF